ncbi:MAG: FprA family A-type flavoprotein [Elusimicrobiales bacterium]|nr:FprA family A-type flavoprotein [Elusimicrobiales bacterium]
MSIRKITDSVYFVGSIDWDRRLFDELIPLPEGTTYNAYLIKTGEEEYILLDTVDPTKSKELIENLKKYNLKNLSYLISNHAEQDHSGSIPFILDMFPECKVITNRKCADMLKDLLDIKEEKFKIVSDGEKLKIGSKTFEFMLTPWTHWPETMVTYLHEDKILFPCDLFGSHYATSDLYAVNDREVYLAAKRYYAEIMMPFREHIRKYIERFFSWEIDIIAPSHGPIYNRPQFIIDAYNDWVSDNVKKEVIIPFVSMHESTRVMVDYLVDKLIERNVTVKPFNLTKTDIGELAMELVDAAAVVFGTPLVLGGPHPVALYAIYLANLLRPKVRYISVIGSYGWGGKMLEVIKNSTYNLKASLIEPVLIKGLPREEDFRKIDRLVEDICKEFAKIV